GEPRLPRRDCPRRRGAPAQGSRPAPGRREAVVIGARFLADERDTAFLRIIIAASGVMIPFAALLFALDGKAWWLAPIYWAVWLRGFAHPLGHLLHRAIHRPVFARRYNCLNHYVDWVLSVLLGHTPTTFHIHHLAMHHLEENLPDDL